MDLNGLLVAIGGVIGALVTGYKAFGASKKETYSELKDTIQEFKDNAEFYRTRWLAAEKQCDELRKELEDAKRKNN